MKEKKEKVRFSGWIDKDLFDKVNEEADIREGRSFNSTLQILLNQAIKERERQRNKNNKRKDNSVDA